jgi:hypothetical protein
VAPDRTYLVGVDHEGEGVCGDDVWWIVIQVEERDVGRQAQLKGRCHSRWKGFSSACAGLTAEGYAAEEGVGALDGLAVRSIRRFAFRARRTPARKAGRASMLPPIDHRGIFNGVDTVSTVAAIARVRRSSVQWSQLLILVLLTAIRRVSNRLVDKLHFPSKISGQRSLFSSREEESPT